LLEFRREQEGIMNERRDRGKDRKEKDKVEFGIKRKEKKIKKKRKG